MITITVILFNSRLDRRYHLSYMLNLTYIFLGERIHDGMTNGMTMRGVKRNNEAKQNIRSIFLNLKILILKIVLEIL